MENFDFYAACIALVKRSCEIKSSYNFETRPHRIEAIKHP